MSYADWLIFALHFTVFFLGAGVGSFLNVVIYRLPLGISVNHPKRSFCPKCKTQIPAYRNLPLITWLLQRGRCASCRAPIPFRYFFIELFTGLLFYVVFLKFHGDLLQPTAWGGPILYYWILCSLLIAGTFIDIDHFILPHEITRGGAVAGLIGATLFPSVMQQESHLYGFLYSLLGGIVGFLSLWIVVELGKLAFGKTKQVFDKPEAWSIVQPNESEPPSLNLGGELTSYYDIFTRSSDRLIFDGSIKVNQQSFNSPQTTAEVYLEKIVVKRNGKTEAEFPLEEVKSLEGKARSVTIPREAMGFGDVYLMMMIGTFLGWQAVLFTVLASSVLGSLVGGIPRLLGKADWGKRIPFGPYIAAGGVIYLFYGPALIETYLKMTGWSR